MRDRFIYDYFRRMNLWPRRIVSHAKCSDRFYDREFLAVEYIDPQFLVNRLKRQKRKCHYCTTLMQIYNRRAHDGLTCERLDMQLPHTKRNVVLCCSACNCRRFTPKSLLTPRNIKYITQRTRHAHALKQVLKTIRSLDDSRRSTYC